LYQYELYMWGRSTRGVYMLSGLCGAVDARGARRAALRKYLAPISS